jgi:hypothetical protein
VCVVAKQFGVDPGTVQRISRPFAAASRRRWITPSGVPAGLYFWIPSPTACCVTCFTLAVPHWAQAPIVDGRGHMSLVIAVIVLVIAIAGVSVIRRVATVEPAWGTQPLNREQPLMSATEARRLNDRQQLNKYFLQNWRDRPTRPNLD